MPERHEEAQARRLVETALGVPLRLNDDNSADSMPDYMIPLADGTEVPLEVVSEPGTVFVRFEQALEKFGRERKAPELRVGWQVDVEHYARVKRLWEVLPAYVARLDDARNDGDHIVVSVPPELKRFGVRHVIPRPDQPGVIEMYPAGFSMQIERTDGVLNAFVEDMLERHCDVPKKLLAAEASERHAFIWAMTASAHPVIDYLGIGRGWPEPADGPLDIPAGITDVWVANDQLGSKVLHWRRGTWQVVGENQRFYEADA